MKISVQAGRVESTPTELLVLSIFENEPPSGATGAVDKALGGLISELVQSGDFKGKLNDTAVLYTRGAIPAKRVLVVGLGKREKFGLDKVRQAAGAAAKKIRDLGIKRYATIVHGAEQSGRSSEQAAQAVVEGTLLALFRFTEFKVADREDIKEVNEMTLVEADPARLAQVEAGAKAGQIIAEAANYTRTLAERPANAATPTLLAKEAEELAKRYGLACQVLDKAQMEQLGMGAFLGVARGSQEPPKFIILEHNAERGDLDTIVVVGKGLTFDSGGLSIKPSEKMEEMKYDMAGGAAVLGTMRAAAELKLPLHLVGLVPATENMPSGTATKPGDILRSLSGQTIEVISTDAEGRLILADALTYAARYHPQAVIDLATLTGACVVALGTMITSGVLGNDEVLIERLKRAGDVAGERVWELPLWEEYDELIKSEYADMKNTGGRPGGAITAAALLKKFAKDHPWAHVDIAGTAWTEKEKPYFVKGATGMGVRLVTQFLRDWIAERVYPERSRRGS